MNNTLILCLLGTILQSPAVLFFSGVSSAEELDSGTVEKYERIREHPVPINEASRGRLLSCGLFTPYQAASLLDYRERNGDILSFSELALVDGIGEVMAGFLREYVSLASRNPPGTRRKEGWGGNARIRASGSGWMGKLSVDRGGRAELNLNWKGESGFNGSAAYYGRGCLDQLVLGSFNARFGQGLILWNGLSFSGFSTTESFCKKESGISASNSTTPDLRGVAACFSFGKWEINAMGGIEAGKGKPNLTPAVNIGRRGRIWDAGFTVAADSGNAVAGLGGRVHISRTELFSELAWDFRGEAPAAVFGFRTDFAWETTFCALARYYSPGFSGKWSSGARSSTKTSDETGLAMGFGYKWLDATLDAVWHPHKRSSQIKLLASAKPEFHLKHGVLTTEFRAAARLRPEDSYRLRTELRGELDWTSGVWKAHIRIDGVHCRETGILSYLEGGYVSESFATYLRAGIFRIDRWDDRIYVYERDVPGMFNVPAYYGRGWNASLVAGFKSRYRPGKCMHGLNLRLGYTGYAASQKKPAGFEWRAQYSFRF